MKFKKAISLLLVGAIVSSLMVGCGKEIDTSEDLNDLGKKSIINAESYDYKKLDTIDNSTYTIPKYERVKICGRVESINTIDDDKVFEICLEDNNSTPYPLYINIPKHMVDVKFKEGDMITVYGTFQGLLEKDVKHWAINGYFIELGDTTDKEIGKEKATKEKQVDKNVENKEDKTKVNTKEKQENKNEITKNKEETKKSKTKKTEKQNTKKENKDEEIKVKKEQQDKTDEIYDEDDNSQTCVVCGEFVPVSSMCECDGTIHHEYCKHHMYHCPNCRRKSTSDPYVYGCAWCGWTSDEKEYDVDTTDDGEDIED